MNIVFFQQNIAWEDPLKNYQIVEDAFARALESKGACADILVAPETFSTGFCDNMKALAEEQEGPTLDFARDLARKHNALFAATWPVRDPKTKNVYNRLHLVRPDGSYNFYDKGHTFRMSSEASQLARGENRITIEWRGWRIRPAICYDLRFPKWLRNHAISESGEPLSHEALDKMPMKLEKEDGRKEIALDYDILLICANWPGSRHQAWTTLLQARAIENLAFVVGVNRVGTDGVGIPYSGCSAAIDFKGTPLCECKPDREEVAFVSLDRTALTTFRRHWPFYLDFD